MKVIAGSAKGRNLKFPKLPKGKRLRPLTGQAKEALYNILAADIADASFLDLFAGTGSVGIEALSRGAKLAIFVEMDRKVVETLRENLEITGFSDRSEVYCLDVLKALDVIGKRNGKFDIVFIGAPYHDTVLFDTMKSIAGKDILNDDGVVIAEHSVRQQIDELYGNYRKVRDARYGDTVLSFYKKEINK
jgi:16S rRNA (guanine966-N2)-methyltransferase